MRKHAAPPSEKCRVCSVTQRTKKVKLEVTMDSGADESVKKKMFVAAIGQQMEPLRPKKC